MSLIINKVSSGSTQITYNYLDSTHLFGYDITANYTIDVADITFDNGSGVLLTGIEALNTAYARKNIVARIGGDEFINGRFQSLSVSATSLTGATEAKIVIVESKRLDSYASDGFTQYLASPQWIESFQETFNFSRSDDSYSFTRNVSIKYKQDAGNQFLNNAKFFLRNMYFLRRPEFGIEYDGLSENARYNRNLKTNKTENIDLINLSVSFSESFQSSQLNTSNSNYSTKIISSKNIDEKGFTNFDITTEIKALIEPLEENALNYTKEIIDNYTSIYSSTYGRPILIEKGINKDGGIVNLKMSFTNDPSKNQANFISYSVGKNKTGAYYEYQLTVNYSSDGKDFEQRFTNVKSLYSSGQASYTTKISSVFSSVGSIYEKSRSTSFIKHEGKISENLVFSNDTAYDTSGGVLKFKRTTSKTERPDLIQKVIDLTDLNEKVVSGGKKGVGAGSITTIVVPFKSKGLMYGASYLDNNPDTIDGYITSNQITIDSANGTTTRVINYTTDS
jgi:hypothetical protein